MVDVLLTSSVAVSTMMLVVWLTSLPLRDVSIIDSVWGAGFVLVAWTVFFTTESTGPTRWLLPGLTTFWGIRLSAYLAWRNHGKQEDKRYARMRENWGRAFPLISLFTVFGLQAIIMWIVSLPLQLGILQSASAWSVLHAIGIALWSIGQFFEAVGDWQLARFRADPNNDGKVLDTGLWRYTRHPNYFGDFCVWWGLYFIALAGGGPWWTIIGPIVMSIFLLFISGVSLLENDLTDRKPEYADYVQRTSAFLPMLPSGAPIPDDGPNRKT